MSTPARRAFDRLTPRGRARRLRPLVLAALARYPVQVRRLRLVANHLNAVFRADLAGGGTLAVRVALPGWRTEADLRAEVAWLEALARDTEIGAPAVVRTACGSPFATATGDGVPGARRCLVTSWIPGRPLADDLSAANVHRLGALSARLHLHAAAWRVPAGFAAARMDSVCARGEPWVVSGGVFAEAERRVASELAALWAGPEPPRVIHGDLNQDNVKVWRGQLRPLDFEDVALGYPVQDIALTFQDLLFYCGLGQQEYLVAREAFAEGYAALARWPEAHAGQIDAFIAARLLWRANYAARFQGGGAFLDRVSARLRDFLRTGTVQRPR